MSRHDGQRSHFTRFWVTYSILALVAGGVLGLVYSIAAIAEGFALPPEGAVAPSRGWTAPRPSLSPGEFGDGTWTVGRDLSPGTYRASVPAGAPGCYWQRLRGPNDVLVNAHVVGPKVITVKVEKTDKLFDVQGCGAWRKI